MSQEEVERRRVNGRTALELCDREICELIQQGHGERTITLRAKDHRITFAEVVTKRPYKLT